MASPVEQPNCDICNIVKLKKMTSMWRKCNRAGGGGRNPPSDVPPGHLAVLVGTSRRRFVIKAGHLNHPIFRQLLDQAYEEYSHLQRDGPLALPCDESLFREVVGLIECCVYADPSLCHVEEWTDLAPLICGSMRRSAC